MSWEGGNYEDAMVISEQVVRDDKFTSVHIEKHEVEARDTKLGPEEITRDIPNVGEDALKTWTRRGSSASAPRWGRATSWWARSPPRERQSSPPRRSCCAPSLVRKAREVKDSSLRLPHGEHGIVVDLKEFTRDEHRDMKPASNRRCG
jgi:DNA-directed RNA polymerase subunit beta